MTVYTAGSHGSLRPVDYPYPEPDPDDWRDDAKCRGQWHLFFKPEPDPYAAALCAACPVRDDCLDDALMTGATTEFRAGLTPAELRAEDRLRKRGIRCRCLNCGRPFRAHRKRPYCDDRCRSIARRAW